MKKELIQPNITEFPLNNPAVKQQFEQLKEILNHLDRSLETQTERRTHILSLLQETETSIQTLTGARRQVLLDMNAVTSRPRKEGRAE